MGSWLECYVFLGLSWPGWPDVFVKKIAQNVAQTIFAKINSELLAWKNLTQTFGPLCTIVKKTAQCKQSPNG
jgi:hypothetical protein